MIHALNLANSKMMLPYFSLIQKLIPHYCRGQRQIDARREGRTAYKGYTAMYGSVVRRKVCARFNIGDSNEHLCLKTSTACSRETFNIRLYNK